MSNLGKVYAHGESLPYFGGIGKYPAVKCLFLGEFRLLLFTGYTKTLYAEKVVGKTSVNDCRHIAIATLNKADILASWNFRHIVNLERIKGYNGVNLKCGYSIIEIRSLKELLKYGNK